MNRRSFAFRGIVASGVSVMGSSAVMQPAQGQSLYIYVCMYVFGLLLVNYLKLAFFVLLIKCSLAKFCFVLLQGLKDCLSNQKVITSGHGGVTRYIMLYKEKVLLQFLFMVLVLLYFIGGLVQLPFLCLPFLLDRYFLMNELEKQFSWMLTVYDFGTRS